MTVFYGVLFGWLAVGYVLITLCRAKKLVTLESFPEYGVDSFDEPFLHFLLCLLFWPYTLYRAWKQTRKRGGDGEGDNDNDDNDDNDDWGRDF